MTAEYPLTVFHDALFRLSDPGLLRELSYVGGQWIASRDGKSFQVTDPSTAQPIACVTSLDADETAGAISAAAKAFPSWRDLMPQNRADILRDWHKLILDAREDLALLITLEQGKPLDESRGEIDYAASFVEWYAEEGKRINAEGVTSHLPNAEMIVRREALGVVGILTPWNFPCAMITRKAAAALAAGCTVVAHPSSETPLSALALAELGHRAGIPDGVFNVVTGNAAIIAGRMNTDARIRAMSFTGSTQIGKLVAGQCTPTMKRLVMELGGHAPLIVFADACIDKAVDIAINAKFATSGQDCLAANRIYVERPMLNAFAKAFKTRIETLKVGNGLEAAVEIGPLMHERAIAKIEEQVADALSRGATLLTGGKRHKAGQLFYEPTLLTDVSDNALIMREETFGPVAAVTAFDSEAEVITRANDTEYGLVAYIVTENGARQMRLSRALEYGMVAVNRVKITGGPIPFGGWKQSGLGREGSRHGIEAFTELKYLCIDTAA
ncbi:MULTISPECIES: NAD-dependent succinate-semialdehyde dehydrogenase [Agrobacterium]|uniref:NAD-dependent succinate-semialdehyde dehydrogenase n=1 Tax=Agrobacterium rubi TaxID=28099 RepID=A0AAE7R7M6_9HYPH|nr:MULTISPECIES: NAD-dependent succinate-semialdehyde dehydrogenase [Agrobacterium]MBN7807798.1 NAD-dependent succinate-semialdehyde dehydrogenase [Agrobacterium rosae]NTE89757.1 NAD-dependent succinate-semialdehyde dehydrogenase [Agrobacterium rubi]NTF05393.1 NAD-dependent succinate-semialdehyde dehydrogenase [Agrobacterium rubi]NTF39837.1 NAD-dependent succinate-semialdehyde dehydrogenase [Agrobacterium rubi]OCJ44857.1 NAD-dependent succinate-semialdehyde dehydrogenase [Agrobacterium rubi]